MALEKAVLIAVGARDDAKIVMANVDDAYDDFDTKIDEIKYVKLPNHRFHTECITTCHFIFVLINMYV